MAPSLFIDPRGLAFIKSKVTFYLKASLVTNFTTEDKSDVMKPLFCQSEALQVDKTFFYFKLIVERMVVGYLSLGVYQIGHLSSRFCFIFSLTRTGNTHVRTLMISKLSEA